jgi:hypothetical protein
VLKFIEFANNLLSSPRKKIIRRVARLIGLMTTYTLGLKYVRAHIKSLEIDKNRTLAKSKGNF